MLGTPFRKPTKSIFFLIKTIAVAVTVTITTIIVIIVIILLIVTGTIIVALVPITEVAINGAN